MKVNWVVHPRGRCYLRGLTLLGIFNTICGCLFGQVLVRVTDTDTGKTVRWYWDAAVKHPPEVHISRMDAVMDEEQRLKRIADLLKRAWDLRTRASRLAVVAAEQAAKAAEQAAEAAELEYEAAKLRAGK
jgi:hypothetical protein